jgi:23S rRNA (uracil1939-C5)-methyltransferase
LTDRRIVTIDIDELNPSGDGEGTAGATRISVPFTIPGERVRVRVGPSRRGRADGTLIDVVRHSPHRVTPACRHFGPQAAPGLGACGGCSWQHIAYPEQLRLKTHLVDRLVHAIVRDAPTVRSMLPATRVDYPWGYRNKVHFVFAASLARAGARAELQMGHYVRGSRRVIPVVECPVHDERGNAFAFAARDLFASALQQNEAAGSLRSLAVRAGVHTDELMATLVVRDDRNKAVRAATRRLFDIAPPTSMHLNVHSRDDAFIFGRSTRRLHGPSRMREMVHGATFLLSPTAFFQTNVRAAELLVNLALGAIDAPSRVIDLYAGSGLFAIPIALAGSQVTAIEDNREAVADGEAALKLNPGARDRCRFVARRVEDALTSLRAADVVVLDPPREGCVPGVLLRIASHLQPRTIVYVSCNPQALAKDLGILHAAGYQIRALQPVDMFPHSAHIETVAVLHRRGMSG